MGIRATGDQSWDYQPATDAAVRSEDCACVTYELCHTMNVCGGGDRSYPHSPQRARTREVVHVPDIFTEMGVLPDEPV